MINSILKIVQGWIKVKGNTDGTFIGNNSDRLKVYNSDLVGLVDTQNSSTTPLGSGATFTGTSIEITNYAAINVAAFSDVDSAVDGLEMQFSPDGTNWDHKHKFSVTGNVGVSYAQAAELRYFRIVYVNGATAQTSFRLTTILKPTNVSPSRYSLEQPLSPQQMADVVKSLIWGKSTAGGNTYVAAKVTPSGAFSTSAELDENAENAVDVKYPLKDAFGRIRTSNPSNLFELIMYQDQIGLDLTSSLANGGTTTFNSQITSQELAVTTTTNSRAIVQTTDYIPYKAGRSQLIKITGNFKGAVAGVNKYYGQFDNNNGSYFVLKGTTAYVGLRSSVTGSIVDTEIAQANWNIDRLDGTGVSGHTIDFSNQQIFVIDYQWQGSGRVRYGFFIDDKLVYCHVIYNANEKTTPYTQTAQLPIRAEILNTATTASSMHITCLAVDSEGQESPVGQLRTVSNGTTAKAFSTAGTRLPVLSLRKKSTELTIPLQVLEVGLFANSADDFLVEIVLNGVLTGATWTANTGVGEFDVASTAISNGVIIYSTYIRGNTNAPSVLSTEITKYTRDLNLGASLAGVSEIISIVATNITANAQANAFINYRDLK